MESSLLSKSRALADGFLKFVNYAVSPFHAVEWSRQQLNAKGYKELHEIDNWSLSPG